MIRPAHFSARLGAFLLPLPLVLLGACSDAEPPETRAVVRAGAAGEGAAGDEAAGEGTAEPDEAEGDGPSEDLLRIMSPAEADPDVPRGVLVHEEEAFDGYTLIAPLNSTRTHLVDMEGEIAHTWETDSAPGAASYLLEDGSLLRAGREDEEPHFRGGGIGGRIQRIAPDGTVTWRYSLADELRHAHHDLEPLPNGNVLVIAWERKSAEEAIARGRDPRGVGAAGLWADAVYEIRPTPPEGGEIVWEWHVWDHLVQDRDPEKPNYGALAEHPGRVDVNAGFVPDEEVSEEEREAQEELERQMEALGYADGGEGPEEEEEEEQEGQEAEDDEEPSPRDRSGDWLHTNAVDHHPELDLIVLSTPQLCELWVIDHSTTTEEAAGSTGGRYGRGGDLLWRWGNPAVHGAGGEEDRKLFYQHDPTWLTGADGLRLLVFNNGGRRPDGDYSSVEELVLPFDPETGFPWEPGEPWGPAAPVWSYSDPETFFSAFISGAQRLPNGNTLVCSGAPGRVFEVTREKEIVWDFRNPYGGEIEPPDHAGDAPPLALFRATRVPAERVQGVVAR